MRKKFTIADAVIYAVITLSALICLLPTFNTLAISLSSSTQVAAGAVAFWPKDFSLEAYKYVLGDDQFYMSFLVSIKRVILGCSLNFVMTILAAYPLSHSATAFRARNRYMLLFICVMIFSGGLIPSYILISRLGLIDTLWALVLPGAVPIWNCILLMNYFRSLPEELEEACYIDGAQPIQILIRVYLPLSLPSLATVTLFSAVGHWNDFFAGLVYMNSSKNYPLATYINTLVNETKNMIEITDPQEMEEMLKRSATTVNSAKIFISMIPILIIYPFLQKYFVTGLVMGSVKE